MTLGPVSYLTYKPATSTTQTPATTAPISATPVKNPANYGKLNGQTATATGQATGNYLSAAEQATEKTGFFSKIWSGIKWPFKKIAEHTPEPIKNGVKWLGKPIGGTAENPNFIGKALNNGATYLEGVNTKATEAAIKSARESTEKVSEEAAAASVKEGAKEVAKTELKVGMKGTLARLGSKALSGLSKGARAVPIVGIPLDFISNKIGGDSNSRAATKSVFSTLGAVAATGLGMALATNPLGWVALTGLAIGGGLGGSWAGEKFSKAFNIGSNKNEIAEEEQKKAAEKQKTAVVQSQTVTQSPAFSSLTTTNTAAFSIQNPTAGMPDFWQV